MNKETPPLLAITSTNHQELLHLDAISSPLFPVILGLPGLQAHNPQIDWSSGSIKFLLPYCQKHCMAVSPSQTTTLFCMDSDIELCQTVPEPYHEFLDVFSKRGADILSPHRPYDCPIELLPGVEIPFGRIFPFSELELGVLKDCIDENLQKGFSRPSISPASAGIFFVEKKDHSLQPCVDYRDLNKITVKNSYPLPLVPELFQRLKSATIFMKLDLRGPIICSESERAMSGKQRSDASEAARLQVRTCTFGGNALLSKSFGSTFLIWPLKP